MTEHPLKQKLLDTIGVDAFEFNETAFNGCWIWDLSEDGDSWASPRFCESFGYDAEGIPQGPKFWKTISHPDDWVKATDAVEKALKDPIGVYDSTCRFRHKKGHWVTIQSRGRIYGSFAVGVQLDQTEVATRIYRLEQQSRVDYDTGILNRLGIEEAIPRAMAHADRSGLEVYAAMIDLDDFKNVNTKHGHAAGDIVIRHTAKRLRNLLRMNDDCGRTGGDEFMALVVCRNSREATSIMDRLRLGVNRPVRLSESTSLQITCTAALVRVTRTPGEGGATLNEIIEKASPVLGQAKGSGTKNCVAHSDSVFPSSTPAISLDS